MFIFNLILNKMATFKKILSSLVLLCLCAYSTWKNMQTLAIVAICLFLASLYTYHIKKLLDIFFILVKQTKQAKLGNLEVNLRDDPLKQAISENLGIDKAWAKAIISDLTPTHIGLLLAINKAGHFQCSNQIKNTLRDLRAKGLLQHNAETIADSDTVWLTDIGNDLVNIIMTATKAD